MYIKDLNRIDHYLRQIKPLIDEIPRDMKSQTFFQPNRSLHELFTHFFNQLTNTLINGVKIDNDDIEIVDCGKSASFSTSFKKEEIDEIRKEADSR
jgi:hypothetical protein